MFVDIFQLRVGVERVVNNEEMLLSSLTRTMKTRMNVVVCCSRLDSMFCSFSSSGGEISDLYSC